MYHKKIKILHILPSLNIGGVEAAIYLSYKYLNVNYDYRILSIKGEGHLDIERIYVCTFWDLKRYRPDIIVSSLWYSHIIGYFLSLIFKTPWISFFHSAHKEKFPKNILLNFAARKSSFHFYDSQATLKQIYNAKYLKKTYVIPYFFKDDKFVFNFEKKDNDFIFVGRLSKEKRIDLFIELIKKINLIKNNYKSIIILSGSKKKLNTFIQNTNFIGLNIKLYSNVNPFDINKFLIKSKAYVLLSDFEGFSMSTILAMSYGCFPIVRPVGEILSYVDENSGLILDDISEEGINMLALNIVNIFENKNILESKMLESIKKSNAFISYNEALACALQDVYNYKKK